MDIKRFVTGTLVGGVTSYAVGYLIWNLAFANFFAANVGSATGVPRDAEIVWAVAIGNLATGALLTLAIGTRARAATVVDGFKIGAIVAFLMWLSVDFIFYGIMNLSNLTATVVDPLLEMVHGGISGIMIAAALAMTAPDAPARPA